MLLIVFGLDHYFGVARPFFQCPIGHASKFPKNELNLSRPGTVSENYKKHFLPSFRPQKTAVKMSAFLDLSTDYLKEFKI